MSLGDFIDSARDLVTSFWFVPSLFMVTVLFFILARFSIGKAEYWARTIALILSALSMWSFYLAIHVLYSLMYKGNTQVDAFLFALFVFVGPAFCLTKLVSDWAKFHKDEKTVV